MRLLLIANVKARTVTPRKVRFMERALASRVEVDVIESRRGGHATDLARRAAGGTHDVVVTLGGDGTVNEVANGLAGGSVPMGIIPGGATNVFARSLGIPRDPIRAAGHLLALLDTAPRRIPLGRAAGRYFTFTCGVGLDGEIVRRVERRQTLKKAAGLGFYVWSALRVGLLGYDLRTPRIGVRWGSGLAHARDGFVFLMTQNTSPFSYLGRWELRICPGASLEGGLDCFGAGPTGRVRLIRMGLQTLGSQKHVRDRRNLYVHDQRRLEVTCSVPLPVQMDGELAGEHMRVLIESVPDALPILA